MTDVVGCSLIGHSPYMNEPRTQKISKSQILCPKLILIKKMILANYFKVIVDFPTGLLLKLFFAKSWFKQTIFYLVIARTINAWRLQNNFIILIPSPSQKVYGWSSRWHTSNGKFLREDFQNSLAANLRRLSLAAISS